jgi:hypothetical protein
MRVSVVRPYRRENVKPTARRFSSWSAGPMTLSISPEHHPGSDYINTMATNMFARLEILGPSKKKEFLVHLLLFSLCKELPLTIIKWNFPRETERGEFPLRKKKDERNIKWPMLLFLIFIRQTVTRHDYSTGDEYVRDEMYN